MNNFNDFDDFDEENQALLNNLQNSGNIISFDDLNNGFIGNTNPFESVMTNRTFQEISNEYAMNSPFGVNSLFYKNANPSKNAINLNQNTWLYEIIQNEDGTKLIEEYRKYDKEIEDSSGSFDDKLDFYIYVETNIDTFSLGNVLLIKMSAAMIEYYLKSYNENPNTTYLNQLSKQIIEQNKSLNLTENDLVDAFLIEIEYRVIVYSGNIKLTRTEIVGEISNQVSDKIRNLKITRESYDPTLNSNKYKLSSLNDAKNYIIEQLNEVKKEINNYKKKLEVLNIVIKINPLFETNYIESYIAFLKSLEKRIDFTILYIKESFKASKEYFAFLCGILNGLIELICGIIDIVIFLLEIIFVIALKENVEYKIDVLQIKEGLEEFIIKYFEDPEFLDNEIALMIESYYNSRYDDPKLTVYQVAHNRGEDILLAADIIISFIAVIKAITNSSKYLPKFTQWIDDVVQRNPRAANKIENAILKLAKVVYGESELSKIAIKFRKTLPIPAHGGNIAVFEYLDDAGKIKRKEFTTIIESLDHAEIIGMRWLRENKIPNDKVVKIYSELEPCSLQRSNCKQKLQQYENAKIEYSYDYPGDEFSGAEIRRLSIAERKKDLKKLVK